MMPTQHLGQSSDSEDEESNENGMTKDEYMMQLRKREVLAYHYICGVFRAQGHLTPEKLKLLREIAGALYIPEDRHRAECRIALNDSTLSDIANCVAGPGTEAEWIKEGTDLRPPSPPQPPPNPYVLRACDKVRDAILEARRRNPGAKSVTAYVSLRPNWWEAGDSSDEEVTTTENKDDTKKEQQDENKDDDVSSLSDESSEDSAEEDQKNEDVKKDVKDKVLMPPSPAVTTASSGPSEHTDPEAPPATIPSVDTIPCLPPAVSEPLSLPVITIPPPISIAVVPTTSSQAESLPTSSTHSVSVSHSSEINPIDSQTPVMQETPILSESEDIQFLSLPDSLDSSLPPLVVVPPAEPVITVPHSSAYSPSSVTPTSTTLVLPSGMSFQVREAGGDVKKRKRTLSQDSGANFSPSPKTVAFSNISKMTPVMVSAAGGFSHGQIKVSRANVHTTSTSAYSTSLPNSTQKVIIVSNASSSNGPVVQRSLSVPVGPIIRTSQPHSGVLQPPNPGTGRIITKFRPKMVSVPARCRAKNNPLVVPSLQLKTTTAVKQDTVTVVDANLKRVPASSGPTRILPKPQGSGQMFIVNPSQGTKVATAVGGQALVEGVKPVSVGAKQNVVIVQKGTGPQRALTLTNTSKELMQRLMSKKCVVIQSSKVVPKNISSKPTLPVTTSAGNVVVLDLSQEQYRHNLSNTTIADILQASGIITSSPPQTIVTSAALQDTQPSDVSATVATEPNWMSVNKTLELEEMTLPIGQSDSVVTLDEAVEMLGDQSEEGVTDLVPQDNTLHIGEMDTPDQIFTITPEELAASEIGFLSAKSMVIAEPLTGQIVVDSMSAEMGVSHSFPPRRAGAVTIQHSNTDMPTNMSLEEYSSQQMENQGLQ